MPMETIYRLSRFKLWTTTGWYAPARATWSSSTFPGRPRLQGVDDGNPICHEPFKGDKHSVFHGLGLCVVEVGLAKLALRNPCVTSAEAKGRARARRRCACTPANDRARRTAGDVANCSASQNVVELRCNSSMRDASSGFGT